MLSGRFNEPEILKYIKDVRRVLEEKGVKTFLVDCREGDDFSEAIMEGLYDAWGMIVFGTSEYGAKTGAGYETYEELRYAHQKKLPLRLPPEIHQNRAPHRQPHWKHSAARGSDDGPHRLVQFLLNAKASLKAEDNHRLQLLHWAAEHGHLAIVRLFLAANTSLEAQDGDGDGPLHCAVVGNRLDVVQQLGEN
eukprot:Skav205801  [mRNA]  locus=scaffold307:163822:164626:- [translate_table: standard]